MILAEQSVYFHTVERKRSHLKKKYIEERIENRYSEKDI